MGKYKKSLNINLKVNKREKLLILIEYLTLSWKGIQANVWSKITFKLKEEEKCFFY